MDKILIGKFLGTEMLGYYNIAYQLMIRPMTLLNPVITKVGFPVLSQIQQDDQALKNGYLRMIQVVAFVTLPIYCGLFAVSQPLCELVLGRGWEATEALFHILIWLGILYSLGNPLGSLLLAKGRADISFWFNFFALFVNAIFIWIGCSRSVDAVALGLVVGTAGLITPVEFFIRWHLVRMRPWEYGRKVYVSAIVAVMMILFVVLFDRMLGTALESRGVKLAALIVLGGATYLAGNVLLQRRFVEETIAISIGKS